MSIFGRSVFPPNFHPTILPSDWPAGFWSHMIIFVVILFVFIILMAMAFIYIERRVLGRFQIRIGPNRVGPFGLFSR